ncbi:maleylpyruvate isomerase family mycothiol-dependent enzyme [Streptomyces sp. TRM70308]|uniref:maleylpyruvate isomerase family mycothiol-dependent enzyme n=1 Tax=Streptomyces sp. TRM70308 TaxID=3131932 RepID=UPI003D08469B
MTLAYGRYCDELLTQTRALCAVLTTADLGRTVPTCPDWTLAQLAEHVGQAQRWAAHLVRTRATADVDEEDIPDYAAPAHTDAEALSAWLADAADEASAALLAAGPGTEVWTWWTQQRTDFWARRMTLETVVHRADACLAAGIPFTVTPEVAVDAVDEWLELVCSPALWEYKEELRGLSARAGESLHLHATDAPAEYGAEWTVELGASGLAWRRGHAKATVALRGPLTDVLLAFYRRLPLTSERVEVLGDRELLEFWLERASFD